MRLQSKRARAEQAAAMRRLRDQVADLKGELLEQGRAAGRLASRTAAAEGCLAGARAALAGPYRELRERCARQESEIAGLKRANRSLARQLDNALGHDSAVLSVIDAGGEKATSST